MRKQLLIACLLLLSICSYAQQITVKGIVTSATDKEPLIGATIQVKGSGTGTITGIDGDYTLMNVPANAILVYSTIGYQTQEIKVNGQTPSTLCCRNLPNYWTKWWLSDMVP